MKKYKALMMIGMIVCISNLQASPDKGHKILLKEIYNTCKVEPVEFSHKYTQDEWDNIYKNGELPQIVSKTCPQTKVKSFWIEHIYDFAKEFASDSGKIPKC